MGLDHLVDALITSEDVGVPKPNPQIFRVALVRLGCTPTETVLVGDNWQADVVGARDVGIRPVWLNRFGLPLPDSGVTEITGFEPLAEVLPLLTGQTL